MSHKIKSNREINENNLNVSPSSNLRYILGDEAYEILSRTDKRRLTNELKKDLNLSKSKVILDISKRCPKFNDIIKNIINSKKNNSGKRKSITTKSTNNVSYKRVKIKKDNESSDDDSDYNPDDDYVYDGFVVPDDYNSDDEFLNTNKEDINEDINELYNDTSYMIKDNNNMSDCEWKEFNLKLKNLRNDYNKCKITMYDVINANFNKDDSIWFYRNNKRLEYLEGKDKYDLEDKIQRRFNFLKTLQHNNMYQNFNKNADRDISKDILESKHPENVKKILLYRMHMATDQSDEEYQKALNWMDTILNLPTEVKSYKNNIVNALTNLHNNLIKHMTGMDKVIQQILQAVCVILTDPENKGYILTLVGPPGVGKTTISTLISESIGMGFGHVSCGSINDRSTIMGHSSTYIGSKPGIFTQIQINSGQKDNVILLDEMDKLPDTKMVPILLHVLDRSQNKRFKDEYCPEVEVDLSKNMYIVAVNSLDMFDNALLDRLKIINIEGYNTKTKLDICMKHIIPKIMKRTDINIPINRNVVEKYINKYYSNISGVRDLERFFEDIYEKLLLIKKLEVNKFYNISKDFTLDDLKFINEKTIKSLTNM